MSKKMSKKMTAVEWLEEQMKTWGDLPRWMRDHIVERAKAMEKEQICDAYLKNHLQGCWMKNTPEEYAEQYYNETFKSE